MIKKTLAAAFVAGALLFAGATAASADEYNPGNDPVELTAPSTSVTAGASVTLTATFQDPVTDQATFTVTPTTGATLSSLVKAAAAGSVTKPIVNGVATANFTASATGTYTVSVTDGAVNDSITLTVTAASTGGGTGGAGSTLPSTGGEIPAVALWIGAGALGLGGLAVVAATARRRAQQR